jgi:hypothetical protein
MTMAPPLRLWLPPRRVSPCLLAVALFACAEGDSDPVPEPCRGVSNGPYGSRECAIALAEICEAHPTEGACRLEPTFPFEVSSVQCGWSQVVTFSDPATCSGAVASGKCFAQFVAPEPNGCTESCGGLSVVVEEGALIDHSCRNDGAPLQGVITAETPIGAGTSRVGSCGSNDAPALCDCSAQACQALQ